MLVAITNDQRDIILITKVISKAQTTITLARLALSNYTCYLNFETELNNLGFVGFHGVCIYVSSLLKSSKVNFVESDFKEQVWSNIKIWGSDCLLLGCIYHSPSLDPL